MKSRRTDCATPGKWEVGSDGPRLFIQSFRACGQDVHIAEITSVPTEGTARGNANLIAAAPAMLRYLKATLEDLRSGQLDGDASDIAMVNIANVIEQAERQEGGN
jgi:hypothetical protein